MTAFENLLRQSLRSSFTDVGVGGAEDDDEVCEEACEDEAEIEVDEVSCFAEDLDDKDLDWDEMDEEVLVFES